VKTCLVTTDQQHKETLSAALRVLSSDKPLVAERLDITELGLIAPDLVIVVDVLPLPYDLIEAIRMTRFVVPRCLIAVYTATLSSAWSHACHLAGANCMLATTSDRDELTRGLRRALTTGCFTAPAFDSTNP
jgi:DNA-binding NarL/FixJ family response regulator